MNEKIGRYLRYTSWPIIGAMIGLMAFGVLAISVCRQAEGGSGYAFRQLAYAAVGMVAFAVATLIPYHRVGRFAYPFFAVTLMLLVGVLFLPEIRQSHRWIDLKLVRIQPSEIAKLSFIVLLAWYLRSGDHYRRLGGLIVPFVLTFIPMALILKEPDLGTAILFLPTLYFMLFMAGAKLRHLLGIVAVGTALVFVPVPRRIDSNMTPPEVRDRRALSYWTYRTSEGAEYSVSAAPLALMKRHQLRRIDGWLRQHDQTVARDQGFQLRWSKIILGSGKLTGSGDWRDADVYVSVLPEEHTDFIFSIVGGQWGFVGCLAVLGLYGAIFLFGAEIATVTYDPFGRLLAVGVLGLLFSQVLINVGMSMGVMPITGMTLPLVSYGGSSLVINCAALGLLVNVGQRRPILLGRRPFEHGPKKEKPPTPYGPLAPEEASGWPGGEKLTAPRNGNRPTT